MLISIASGKGGTGKTTLALLLAAVHPQTTLVDCDVEEPNCHLFLKPTWQNQVQPVTVPVPHVTSDRCTGCGRCDLACFFNAIAVAGNKALIFEELCHHCGGCLLACPHGALSEEPKVIGTLSRGTSTTIPGLQLLSGALHIGQPSAVPLIKAMRKELRQLSGDIVLDCPPGTACSMVNALKESDFCILVTEPTPFGRHDLELALNIVGLLNLPAGVVINKSDGAAGDDSIQTLCDSRRIPVLANIPHSLSFAKQYAAGTISDEFQAIAAHIWRQLRTERSAGA